MDELPALNHERSVVGPARTTIHAAQALGQSCIQRPASHCSYELAALTILVF